MMYILLNRQKRESNVGHARIFVFAGAAIMCIALFGCNANYLCPYGTPASGLPEVTDFESILNCVSCDSGYKLFDTLCIPTRYTCLGGDPYPGSPAGNEDVERCVSCESGKDPDPATEFCEIEFPYICVNGTPRAGILLMPNTEQCVSCERGYKLVNTSCVPTIYTCANGDPKDGVPDGNDDVEFCVSCDSTLPPDPVTGICATEFPFICANGAPQSGMHNIPLEERCASCNPHFRLTVQQTCTVDSGRWTSRSAAAQTAFGGLAYGNNLFYATDSDNNIHTSDTGLDWTAQPNGSTQRLNAITYGNNTAVAVGRGGTILTSDDDGATWTARTSGTTQNLLEVSYENTTFFALGANGGIFTSADGVSWTARASGTTDALRGVAYGNGVYIIVGINSTILRSNNGVNWTPLYNDMNGNGRYDRPGEQWAPDTFADFNVNEDDLYDIVYANNRFVAVFYDSTLTSTNNGATWTRALIGTARSQYLSLAQGNNLFVVGGQGGDLRTSTNGTAWTQRTSGVGSQFADVTYGNGRFLASSASALITSTDGITWRDTNIVHYEDVAYGDGTFVAVSEAGSVLTSDDVVTWRSRVSPTTERLAGISYGDTSFVAVGNNGAIIASTDATTWVTRMSGTTENLRDVAYDNDRFVAVGANGAILTSDDDTTWTARISGVTDDIAGVAYDGSRFIAVGEGGVILTSSDGTAIAWSSVANTITDDLAGIDYANNLYVAVGAGGAVFTSSDGATWTSRTSGTTHNLLDITYDGGVFVAIGDNGTIISSADGTNWSTQTSGTTSPLRGITYTKVNAIAGVSFLVTVGRESAVVSSPRAALTPP